MTEPRRADDRHRAVPILIGLLALLASLLLAGCGLLPFTGQAPAPAGGTPEALEANRAAWATTGPRSYEWQVTFTCECAIGGPLTIKVVDGVAIGARSATGAVPLDGLTGFPLTVDDLYRRAGDAIRQGGSVTGTWGAGGLPRTMSIDPIPNAIDDELNVTVDRLDAAP